MAARACTGIRLLHHDCRHHHHPGAAYCTVSEDCSASAFHLHVLSRSLAPGDLVGLTPQIEEELNGVQGLAYFDSTSDNTGSVSINATFSTGTDIAKATIDVQNAVRRVEARLPVEVRT